MKVKFGSIIVSGRGTLGGHVYSENHYGPFARTKVVPFNPQTVYQQNTRVIFEAVQTAWRNLTQPERDSWALVTIDYPRIDYSGTVYFMTGYNLFISLNIPYYTTNLAILASPPIKSTPLSSCDGTMSIDFGTPKLRLTYFIPPNEANVEIQVFSTRSLSAGINYVSTELRLVTLFAANGVSDIEFSTEWLTKFITAPLPGQKLFCRFVPFNTQTGDYGVPFTYSVIQP